MSIAYFVHELADAAVNKRVRMLAIAGRDVSLLGFERDRGEGTPPAPQGSIILGRTRNQRLVSRAFSVLRAVPRTLASRQSWERAELIVARNLEMLALVRLVTRLTGSRARVAYECLDLHRLALSTGLTGILVRGLERLCLRGATLIITSSPAFERQYFRGRQRYQGRIVLAENKVLALENAASPSRPETPPWIIAWCGVLRCERSLAILSRLAEKRGVRVELWGLPALDQIPDFYQRVAATPNMTFHGPYSPGDLRRIYGAAHFSWAIDYYEAGGNSDWLLPNRLYESLCYGAAPIAIAGVETARWLQARKVGLVLNPPLEQTLDQCFAAMTPETYREVREAAARLAPEATRYTPESCRAFAAELAGAVG